ncbi:unnamed protein product [Blepharisma stoltei]|uniref:non-specific serine/threonine protein kinase n=1 Tax=Blepharisma stoltei TaxID=1481888 RepID=A0AAU9JGI9_9CILI|nr:unnamed protein product [Blepharisma stoltei]
MKGKDLLGIIAEEEYGDQEASDVIEDKNFSTNSTPGTKSTTSSSPVLEENKEYSKSVQNPIEAAENYNINPKANTDLWEAVERNDIIRIKELLDRSRYGEMVAQPNARGLNDWTSLHLASSYGFLEASEILISIGNKTNIDALTSMNRTPLHLAALHGHLGVAQLLVQKGANINAKDDDNSTPLHYAAIHGDIAIVSWLLKANPDITITDYLDRTPADVSPSIEIYKEFVNYCQKLNLPVPSSHYTRTPFYSVLLHNSRDDQINRMLAKCTKKPALRDLNLFNERPKLLIRPEKKAISMSPPKLVLPPSKVGPHDFRGLMQLGKGSFGEVYLVEKKDTQEVFALKVLKKEKVFGSNLVRYAFTERNILLKLSHPFIVKLNYSFQTPEKLVLVMDFCPGGDLGMYLSREKRFNEDKAKFYITEILLALEELHKHEILFRDLKPGNVVLDKDGHARLTDFGLSKEGVSDGQLNRSFCGSIAYLAPEMLRRAGHTRSVDWYLLGVLLYEMMVGSPPYYSHNREELFNNIQRGKLRFPKNLSENAKSLIKQLLNRDPSKRLGASKRDADEIKEHPFFENIDWNAFLNKTVTAPPIHQSKRMYRDITTERMFGKLEEEATPAQRLDGWSFMTPS